MELSKEKINEIAAMLKHADGEDVQEILIKSGWNDQMLTQLMMCEPIADVKYIYEDRLELEEALRRMDMTTMKAKGYWIYESC